MQKTGVLLVPPWAFRSWVLQVALWVCKRSGKIWFHLHGYSEQPSGKQNTFGPKNQCTGTLKGGSDAMGFIEMGWVHVENGTPVVLLSYIYLLKLWTQAQWDQAAADTTTGCLYKLSALGIAITQSELIPQTEGCYWQGLCKFWARMPKGQITIPLLESGPVHWKSENIAVYLCRMLLAKGNTFSGIAIWV